jgi:hypothetical protein
MPKVNFAANGENSPNLVTLIPSLSLVVVHTLQGAEQGE